MSLNRCMHCNSTLKKEEVECYACGNEVVPADEKKVLFAKRFCTLANVLFFIFGGMTVASLFLDFAPGFTTCATSTVVMLFVRSSAGQMLEKTSKH